MTNKPTLSRTHVKIRPGAVIENDVASMNLLSIGGGIYYVTFVDEVYGHVRASHMMSKHEAAELPKRQVNCFERQSGCMIRRTVVDGRREYVKGSTDLEVHGITFPKRFRRMERPSV